MRRLAGNPARGRFTIIEQGTLAFAAQPPEVGALFPPHVEVVPALRGAAGRE